MITPGTTISHYTILEQLGAGGMGVVYRAFDMKLDRVVAIKFLPPHLGANEKARARFMAEAKAASALDFPNIGTIYEVDEAPDSGLFIVMAYYPGESLAAKLRRGPLPMPQAVDIAVQVGEGLARAHEGGVLHRDIKPSNLIITPGGIVKIVDFGLAKVADVSLTDAGLALGTPMFMSPEQTLGATLDHRSDIWSLGVVLYHMLAGRPPFVGESTPEILAAVRDREPSPLEAPPGLQAVLARALAKRLRDRYPSARAFVADLRAVYDDLPTPATPDASPTRSTMIAGLTGEETTTVAHPSRAGLPVRTGGERRQLTIVSCELAHFTTFAEQLDAEHLRDLLWRYRQTCEEAILPLDGQIAHEQDGVLSLHFGLPEAHEDDAVRAVTAALAIVHEIPRLDQDLGRQIPAEVPMTARVRVGVHTGPVIVDAASSGSSPTVVVGMTGTLAAKARDAAAPGEVILTGETFNLVRHLFQVRPLGATTLPGISKPQSLYRAEARIPVEHLAGTGSITTITELVGRGRELGLLTDLWDEVKDGTGQVVLISADAGVGKSRLVEALKAAIANEPHHRLECRCSPYHRNSPLWPIVDLLSRLFAVDRSRPAAETFAQIKSRLAEYGLASAENVYLLTSLLSIPLPEGESRPSIPVQREKERTLALLLKLLLVLSSRQSLLFVVEDLHWIDPTTLELLSLAVDQGPTAPLLTILTFRADFSHPWGNRAHLTHLTLTRLSKRNVERMIEGLSHGKALPPAVVAQILNNSDGVPLYVEQLTRALMESEALKETAEGYELQTSITSPAIPTTLQDSLTARLDRLGSAKEVAQMASVLGRTFSYDWLLAVSLLGDQLVRRDLIRLVDAGLLYQRGLIPDASFTFKHALIKDAAYQSLLTPIRQQYHARFAQALNERFRDTADTQPELLAHHYAEAGLTEHAIAQWRQAGQYAARRSGHAEAAAHFGRALELLRTLPKSADRAQQELEVLVALASVQLATMGYAAPAVGDAYTQALKLTEMAGEGRPLFDALQGLFNYYLVRSELHVAREQGERLVELAERLGDPQVSLEASVRLGITLYVTGSPHKATRHLERVAAAAGSDLMQTIPYGQDAVVAALCHVAVLHWLLGFPDRSLADIATALARSRELAHPFTLSWALLYDAIVRTLRHEPEEALKPLQALAALCEEQGFAYRLAQSQILRGWAVTCSQPGSDAVEQIRAGMLRIRATGAEVLRPYYAMLLADACLRVEQHAIGIDAVDDAVSFVERTSERFIEPELHRLRGDLLAASDGARRGDAEACYVKALQLARDQHSRSFELRAAVSMSKCRPDDREATRQLSAIVAGFGTGVESRDLTAARAWLGRPV